MVQTKIQKMKRRYPILAKKEIYCFIISTPDSETIYFHRRGNPSNTWEITEEIVAGSKIIHVKSNHYDKEFTKYKDVNAFLNESFKL